MHSRVADRITLAKIRVNTLVVATTAGGYYMGSIGRVDLTGLLLTCAGTGLVAGGAAVLNQVAERDTDALMERTRMRPVADKRLSVAEGRIVGAVLALSGLALLCQRLTDGYWARQKKLEEAVEQARRNLEKIRSGKWGGGKEPGAQGVGAQGVGARPCGATPPRDSTQRGNHG